MRSALLLLLVHSAAAFIASPTHSRSFASSRCEPPRANIADDDEATADARKALQLQQLERCLIIADLESKAEAAEQAEDLPGAIEAYEELLHLQPPDSPFLREEDAARRALQQLLLESARRELEACGKEGCAAADEEDADAEGVYAPSQMAASFIKSEIARARQIGEDSRKMLAMRALDDVRIIRNTVVRQLQLSEDMAAEDASKAQGEQTYRRLVEGQPGFLAGLQLDEAKRRQDDARLLKKTIEADLNRLELQLLQGDPSLSFIRDVLRTSRNEEVSCGDSLWLEEQFRSGALPRDPELLRTLLAQARRDPEQVMRLVTQAKDAAGNDLFARKKNDASEFENY